MKAIIALTILLCQMSSSHSKDIFTAADNNKRVTVRLHSNFHIVLVGNPTTGFDWHVVSIDTSKIRLLDNQIYTPDTSLAGSPGKRDMQFAVVGTGTSVLRLKYFRSWETRSAADSFSLTIKAQK